MTDMADCGPDCQKVLQELELMIDGELEPDLESDVMAHLADCVGCSDRAGFRRHVKDLVQQKCTQREVPQGLRDRVLSLLSETGGGMRDDVD